MNRQCDVSWDAPDWPLPKGVQALVTTRCAGNSVKPYHFGNLATHVGDDRVNVGANRKSLEMQTGIQRWHWLNQTHSTRVIFCDSSQDGAEPLDADGSYACSPGQACVVLTADCLPILIAAQSGREVAALHAGWRGLCNGILANGIAQFAATPDQLSVYLGPAIGPSYFEVGEDVYEAFYQSLISLSSKNPDRHLAECFIASSKQKGKYFANLFNMASIHLTYLGVQSITSGRQCTYSDPKHFYSYRRDQITGRFASAIWIT